MGAAPHIQLGRDGEALAANLLENRGMRVLDRNWRFGHLELDIVCRDGEYIVFVEVKTRSDGGHGGPAGAITPQKKKKLIKAAMEWLSCHNAWACPCRFDIVCLINRDDAFQAEYIRNAIDFTAPLDSGYSYWQSW